MGLLIILVVGASIGWLIATLVDRDGRMRGSSCVLAGTFGSAAAAILAGDVPLVVGVSAAQLLWGVVGATVAILAANSVVVTRRKSTAGAV